MVAVVVAIFNCLYNAINCFVLITNTKNANALELSWVWHTYLRMVARHTFSSVRWGHYKVMQFNFGIIKKIFWKLFLFFTLKGFGKKNS